MSEERFEEMYLRYCVESTDAPEKYHQAISYLVLSSIVGRSLWLKFGRWRLYPNLFMLIVGPSTLKRKSWSVRIGRNLVREVSPDFQLQDTSSRESFISELARADRMCSGSGLVHVDELKGFVERMKKGGHHTGFIQDLSTLYDGETLRRRKGVSEKEKEEFAIEEPFLNFVAACSFDWLSNSVEASDLLGGFFARFLWIVDNSPLDEAKVRVWPAPGDNMLWVKMVDFLKKIQMYAGEVAFSEAAMLLYENWIKTWRLKNQGGKWDSNYERLTIIAPKLGLLAAVSRAVATNLDPLAPLRIEIGDLKPAIHFCVQTTGAFKDVIIGFDKLDIITRRVASKLGKHHRLTRSELLRGLSNMDAETLSRALRTLVESELVEEFQETVTGQKGPRIVTHYQAANGLSAFLKS